MKLLYSILIALSLSGVAYAGECPGNRPNTEVIFKNIEKSGNIFPLLLSPEKTPEVLKVLSKKFGVDYQLGDLFILDMGLSTVGLLLIHGDCSDDKLPDTLSSRDLYNIIIQTQLKPEDFKLYVKGISM